MYAWSPCPKKWKYAAKVRVCYFFLEQVSGYNWQEANEQCENLGNGSKLLFIDEPQEDEIVFKQFWKLTTAWIWIGAQYTDGTFSCVHISYNYFNQIFLEKIKK